MMCGASNCSKDIFVRGYCCSHYQKLRRKGFIQPLWKIKDTSKMMGRLPKTSYQKGQLPWNTGLKDWISPEHIQAIKNTNTGRPAWNKGKPHLQQENNPAWKGNDVSYRNLHRWVERHLGTPDTCEHCKMSGLSGHKIQWANISREYKRELTDWMRLCASCHGAYDSNKLTLTEIRG